jgi:hypothetical protein
MEDIVSKMELKVVMGKITRPGDYKQRLRF